MMVTYNRIELTKKTIDDLVNKTKSDFRLIVVDNNSIDSTKEYLSTLKLNSKYCKSIDVHYNNSNLGISVARNQCLKIADKYFDEYLSTIDNDVNFPDNWLQRCIDVIEANKNIAVGVSFEPTIYPIQNLNGFKVELKPAGNLGTACTVFPKQLHAMIGFFCMDYGLYGEEDADFFHRARRVGYKIAYLEEHGIHLGEDNHEQNEYRKFKTKSHQDNLSKFRSKCKDYNSGKTPCYIPFNLEG